MYIIIMQKQTPQFNVWVCIIVMQTSFNAQVYIPDAAVTKSAT